MAYTWRRCQYPAEVAAEVNTFLGSQFEPAFGLLPGGGGAQHLTRLMGRARALEVMLSAEDYGGSVDDRR